MATVIKPSNQAGKLALPPSCSQFEAGSLLGLVSTVIRLKRNRNDVFIRRKDIALIARVVLTTEQLLLAISLVCLGMSAGCVSDSYRYGVDAPLGHTQPYAPDSSNPIAHGVAQPKLDRIEAFVQSPRKLLRKISQRPEPDPTEEARQKEAAAAFAAEYLAANGLNDVQIDIRVYQPREQWAKLRANDDIRPIWKYTGGTLSWLRYSILPMRAFHSDHYDPFTNTLNLNSASSSKALYESALAKEFQRHRRFGVGAYAVLQYVPFVPLYHNAKASSDVLTYSQHHLEGKFSEELYPLSYSRLGSTAVSEALSVVTLSPNAPILTGPLLRLAGSTAGRSTGTTLAKKHLDNDDGEEVNNPNQRPATYSLANQSSEQTGDNDLQPASIATDHSDPAKWNSVTENNLRGYVRSSSEESAPATSQVDNIDSIGTFFFE